MSEQKKYLNFDLHIVKDGSLYRAFVVSPAGEAETKFQFPFTDLELDNYLLRIGRPRRGTRRIGSPEMDAARSLGTKLFEAVFSGGVESCLRSSVEKAERDNAGLRIRMRVMGAIDLNDLPWEYLFRKDCERFLSHSVDTPIVRYIDLPDAPRPLRVTPPLRILAIIASPTDHPQLDVEREWANLREALADVESQNLVAVDRLEKASLPRLFRALQEGEYHVLHFIGHGGFDPQTQNGILLFEDELGRGAAVAPERLGTLLYDLRSKIRLVVLNSCEGARTSRLDPFSGTAMSIVRCGVPAVIAMQFEITDRAAITLAREFYGAVAQGDPVDTALAVARKALFLEGNDVEWGTPVLYLRAPDGTLFDIEAVGAGLPPKPSGNQVGERVEKLRCEAESEMRTGNWPKVAGLLKQLLALAPRDESATEQLRQAWRGVALLHEAERARDSGNWPRAAENLRALLELAPGDVGSADQLRAVELAATREVLEAVAMRRQNTIVLGIAAILSGVLAIVLSPSSAPLWAWSTYAVIDGAMNMRVHHRGARAGWRCGVFRVAAVVSTVVGGFGLVVSMDQPGDDGWRPFVIFTGVLTLAAALRLWGQISREWMVAISGSGILSILFGTIWHHPRWSGAYAIAFGMALMALALRRGASRRVDERSSAAHPTPG